MKNLAQIDQKVPKSAPKTILETARVQERSQGGPVSIFLTIIGATWAVWGVIWRPAGRQGTPKI